MKIIGIYIEKGASVVIKNIHPGWYPFGEYEIPELEREIVKSGWEKELDQVYQVYPNLPQISVSCIVGRNGAGKTTMIDVLLRIINNFAYYLLDGKADEKDDYQTDSGRKLSYARGLFAQLYFEVDGNVGMLDCQDDNFFYKYRVNRTGKIVKYDRYSLQKTKNKVEILKNFFFTIECNYSQYGFRPSDYESRYKDIEDYHWSTVVNGEWIEGLFHKNDGYLSPAVLTPFRNNGMIDYVQEERLANRRLITLSILYYTQNKQFVPGYNPSRLSFYYDDDYIKNKQSALIKDTKIFNNSQIYFLIKSFQDVWVTILKEKNIIVNDEERALSYLGYKSLKICLKYPNYQRRFALKTISKQLSKGGNAFYLLTRTPSFFSRIRAIVVALYNDKSHITLKIHQCISFISKIKSSENNCCIDVSEFATKMTRYTFDNVYKSLPPSYYKLELTMIQGSEPLKTKSVNQEIKYHDNRKHTHNEFHFSQMSSGERQLMNLMSYVLFHIKNIQSIKEDSERVPYHHINLIFDEAELYFHPEYQRFLVRRIIDMLHWCHIDRRRIRSINIILATHSPYVLSDVFTEKSLYLKAGNYERVKEQSFGANYYNLLQDSFFFEDSPMGEIATEKIQEWINSRESGKSRYVGDPLIKRFLEKQTQKNICSEF